MADLMADVPLSIECRCLEYCYMKFGTSTGRSTLPVEASSGKNGNLRFLLLKLI